MEPDLILALTVACIALAGGFSSEAGPRLDAIRAAMEKLRPLHKKLGRPGPHDWLAHHYEPGQTFEEYLALRPVAPARDRRAIYVQPLGDFTETQREIITLTADFMGRYFELPVEIKDDLPLSIIPSHARRTHPSWGDKQILSTYVLDRVLYPRLSKDAVACLAFTASDLWPGEGWNFVFGQASLQRRVGVWSIYRSGDPERGPADFRLCLLRTMKTAAHEMGHMFSMLHCTRYECGMCGSNHREEADRRPIALCPECVAKVWRITGAAPVERYRRLAELCKAQGLKREQEFYERSLQALEGR